jgi:peroxiredoxin
VNAGIGRETVLTVLATLATAVCLALALGQPQPAEAGSALVTAGLPATADAPTPVAAGSSFAATPIDPPASPGSGSPALAAENVVTLRRGHDVLMTWLEPGESGGRLRFARLTGEAWGQSITVADPVSKPGPLDPPSLTVLDTQGVRRTLIARTGDVVARSGDAGRTWTRLPAPRLAFASFAGGDEGGYAFWLDSNGDGTAKLRGTRVLAGETILDPRAADGSGTAAAMTWDGPVVAYRDVSVKGARDVAVVRRQDARWTPPHPVHPEARHPAEGPAPGPRMAALARQVAVAWYTEASDLPRGLVAFSSDAGRTFGAPLEVDATGSEGGGPSGFVDIAMDDGGNALVLWTAGASPEDVRLNLARVSPSGGRGDEVVLAEGLSAIAENAPQIVRAGERAAVAWVEGTPGRLRAVAVPLAGVPAPDGGRALRLAGNGTEARPSAVGRGRVGDTVPDHELATLGGEAVSLASLRGHAVLLNLWATWCVPCVAEMPELVKLQEQLGPQGLVVVGLSVDDAESSDKVRAFVSERKIAIPVWRDPEMLVYGDLRVRALPVTFVVDREGRILLRREGAITAEEPGIRGALRRALDGSPEVPGDAPGNG